MLSSSFKLVNIKYMNEKVMVSDGEAYEGEKGAQRTSI